MLCDYEFTNSEIVNFQYDMETSITHSILDSIGIKSIKISPNFKQICVSFDKESSDNEELAEDFVRYIFIHLIKCGYCPSINKDNLIEFLPQLDSIRNENGRNKLFAPSIVAKIVIEAYVSITEVDSEGNEIDRHPYEMFLNSIIPDFEKNKRCWYHKLSNRLNIVNKVERFMALYQFLLDLLWKMQIKGTLVADSRQLWVRDFILEKKKVGLLTQIQTDCPTTKKKRRTPEDEITNVRNLFGHTPDNPDCKTYSGRIDQDLMTKILDTILLAIKDK